MSGLSTDCSHCILVLAVAETYTTAFGKKPAGNAVSVPDIPGIHWFCRLAAGRLLLQPARQSAFQPTLYIALSNPYVENSNTSTKACFKAFERPIDWRQ